MARTPAAPNAARRGAFSREDRSTGLMSVRLWPRGRGIMHGRVNSKVVTSVLSAMCQIPKSVVAWAIK